MMVKWEPWKGLAGSGPDFRLRSGLVGAEEGLLRTKALPQRLELLHAGPFQSAGYRRRQGSKNARHGCARNWKISSFNPYEWMRGRVLKGRCFYMPARELARRGLDARPDSMCRSLPMRWRTCTAAPRSSAQEPPYGSRLLEPVFSGGMDHQLPLRPTPFTSSTFRKARLNEPVNAGDASRAIFGRATAMSRVSCSIATSPRHGTRFRFNTR